MRAILRGLQILTIGITPAAALPEALPAVELVAHCRAFTEDSESVAGRQCDAYIRGFFAALSAEGILAGAAEQSSRETFAERAARTRLSVTCAPAERECAASGFSDAKLGQ